MPETLMKAIGGRSYVMTCGLALSVYGRWIVDCGYVQNPDLAREMAAVADILQLCTEPHYPGIHWVELLKEAAEKENYAFIEEASMAAKEAVLLVNTSLETAAQVLSDENSSDAEYQQAATIHGLAALLYRAQSNPSTGPVQGMEVGSDEWLAQYGGERHDFGQP